MRNSSYPSLDRAKLVLLYVTAFLAFVSLLSLPMYVAIEQLDPAWQVILAHCVKNRLKAGTDFIFTYGPLGYFYTQYFDPALFSLKILWEVIAKGLIVVLLLRLFGFFAVSKGWRIVLLFIVIAFPNLSAIGVSQDAVHTFLLFLVACYILLIGEKDPVFSSIAVVIFALVSLTKMTFFMVFSASLFPIALYALFSRNYRKLWFVGAYIVSFLTFLFLYGYKFRDILGLLYGTKEIAAGYPAAMGLVMPGFAFMMVATALSLFLQGVAFLSLQRTDKAVFHRIIAVAAVWLLVGAFAWKEGFVRADIHAEITIAYLGLSCVLFPVFICAVNGAIRGLPLVASGLACVLCLGIIGWLCFTRMREEMRPMDPKQFSRLQKVARTGQWRYAAIVNAARMVFEHERWRNDIDQPMAAAREANHLPQIDQIVGSSTVDFWPHQQGILFHNGLNYKVRPVIQAYNGYTSYLTDWDARYFLSSDAPKYMLFRSETIDGKYPMMEDPRGLEALFVAYRLVLEEKGTLLLERKPNAPSVETLLAPTKQEPRERRKAVWGETIPLPNIADDEWLYISVRGHPNIKGRIKEMALSPTKYQMHVTLSSGESGMFRLNPRVAADGFLLNPFVAGQDDYKKLWKTGVSRRPVSVRFDPESTGGFDKNIEVTLTWGKPPR